MIVINGISIAATILVLTAKNMMDSMLALSLLFFMMGSLYVYSGFVFYGLCMMTIYVGVMSMLFSLFSNMMKTSKDEYISRWTRTQRRWLVAMFMGMAIASLPKVSSTIEIADFNSAPQNVNVQKILDADSMPYAEITALGTSLVSNNAEVFSVIGVSLAFASMVIAFLSKRSFGSLPQWLPLKPSLNRMLYGTNKSKDMESPKAYDGKSNMKPSSKLRK